MGLVSLIVPSAGLYRFNEKLWPMLAAARAGFAFELIIPTDEVSPRLTTRLAQLRIPHKFTQSRSNAGVGELFWIGSAMASGDYLVWMHDDFMPVGSFSQFLKKLIQFGEGVGVCVPRIAGSANPDQCQPNPPKLTTRYIDRSAFAFPRDLFFDSSDRAKHFSIDGYQIAIQAMAAERGLGVQITEASGAHMGGSTLVNVPGRDYSTLLESDVQQLARMLGTYVENNHRPAVPRIIPKGREYGGDVFFDPSGELPDEIINTFDNREFLYRGEKFGRVTMGDRYSIPPLMDVYKIGLVAHTGLGDLLMHSAAPHHFRELYPDIRIELYTYGFNAYVANRLEAWDSVIALKRGDPLPPGVRIWNVANGNEGTPGFGFRDLGIDSAVPVESRRMSVYRRKTADYSPLPGTGPKIGIQLHGGWSHKRYRQQNELAAAIADLGFSPIFFGQDNPYSFNLEFLWQKTPTLDDLAGCMMQLDGWVGFDSGGSYLANSLGIPTVWLFASHNPGGLIESCGANAPYKTIWPNLVGYCARVYGKTCRSGHGGAYFGAGTCGRNHPEHGAECLSEIHPTIIAREIVNLISEVSVK